MNYTVKPLVLGIIKGDKSGFTYMVSPGQPVKLEIVAFLIEGAPKKILVDTGSYTELMKNYWPGEGVDFQTLEEALEKEGMTANDIDIVIQTHLHHDHCGYNYMFKNAEFLVQEEEWNFAMNPHMLQKQYYPKDLLKGWNLKVVKGDFELFPGIDVLFTPGHTPGTQSVVINTSQGKLVIAGFCCLDCTFDNPEDVLPVGHPFANWETFTPSIAVDMSQAYDSTLKLKKIADIILACHGNGKGDGLINKVYK
jgi:glyoxylase-like metal-dependent hydrolase (beta-lactamase superfamily II)